MIFQLAQNFIMTDIFYRSERKIRERRKKWYKNREQQIEKKKGKEKKMTGFRSSILRARSEQ